MSCVSESKLSGLEGTTIDGFTWTDMTSPEASLQLQQACTPSPCRACHKGICALAKRAYCNVRPVAGCAALSPDERHRNRHRNGQSCALCPHKRRKSIIAVR